MKTSIKDDSNPTVASERETANTLTVYFAFPGNLDTPTGGYHYDRRLIDELRKTGMQVHTLSLPDCFPFADQQTHEITRQALSALPDDAMAQVNELKAKMRYFTAIGFHKQSKEQRDAIAAIYAEYGVPLPDEYKD